MQTLCHFKSNLSEFFILVHPNEIIRINLDYSNSNKFAYRSLTEGFFLIVILPGTKWRSINYTASLCAWHLKPIQKRVSVDKRHKEATMLSQTFAEIVCLPSNMMRWPLPATTREFPDNKSFCEITVSGQAFLMHKRQVDLFVSRQVIALCQESSRDQLAEAL